MTGSGSAFFFVCGLFGVLEVFRFLTSPTPEI